MQNLELILRIVYAVIAFLAVVIPLVVALVKAVKKKVEINKQLQETTDEAEIAKLQAANAEATNEMLDICNELIVNAEDLYSNVSALLKKDGSSAGAVKKDSVMSKLQAYALEKGYTFDTSFWSDKIDQIVEMTKKVNASTNE